MTEQEAFKWIGELFEEDPRKLTPSMTRDDIQAWDSLGVLTLMAGLDNDFGIVLLDGEIQNVRSVNDILELLRRHGKLG